MTARAPEPDDAWAPACRRGRFEMHILTAAYVWQEHRALITTPFCAELRCDDGNAPLLNFVSSTAMAAFVREMVPTLIEINHATGEDVSELATILQMPRDEARSLAMEAANSVIAKAARPS